MHLEPGALVERYIVEAKIGAGTFSTTWRARHLNLDTLHALQVPNSPRASLHARMVAGARIQARLRHPHVVAATDVLELNGIPAVVLDYVDGPTLEEFVRAHELDEGSIDAIAAGLFEAIGWLHRNSVVHRNLKLRNVIVDLGSDVYVPRVTDFLLARVLGERTRGKRKGPRIFGTPSFMSPEQTLNSNDVDHRADLWSLACILYQICSGQVAFDGGSPEEVFQVVRAGRYLPLRSHVPSAPRRWAEAIEAALVIDPEDRVASAEAMAELWFSGTTERPRRSRRAPPVGHIALVFTDIQGSTGLWEARPELARHSLRAHDAILRAALHRNGGYEVKTEGDAFMIAFPDAIQATRFCLDAQRALHEHPWSPELLALPEAAEGPGFRGLRVRMGVHVGEPEARAVGDKVDYFGPMVNRAARIGGAGHGGQTLLSGEAWEAVRRALADALVAEPLGCFQLRGLEGVQELVQVLPPKLAGRTFPAIRANPATPAPLARR